MITHIFFDLHGTMLNSAVFGVCYGRERARWLAEHYRGDVDTWLKATAKVVADWDAYHADLNFSASDGEGMRDYYEAGYRILKALFRCAGIDAPPHDELQRLSLTLPGLVPLDCGAFYDDVAPAVAALAQRYTLGITTHSLATQAHAVLVGAGLRVHFQGLLIGADTAEQFDKDENYYQFAARSAQVDPSHCLTIDDWPSAIVGAKQADFKAIYVHRADSPHAPQVDEADAILPDFTSLIAAVDALAG